MLKRIIDAWNGFKIREQKRKKEYKEKTAKEKAEELFDVGVYQCTMWLFYSSYPVCPMNMFSADISHVELINMMRSLYVKHSMEE